MHDIDIDALPYLPLSERKQLPPIPAIYFAIDSLGQVQYIGQCQDLKYRWGSHHLLNKDKPTRIAWLAAEKLSVEKRRCVEKQLIAFYQPRCNSAGIPGKDAYRVERVKKVVAERHTWVEFHLNEAKSRIVRHLAEIYPEKAYIRIETPHRWDRYLNTRAIASLVKDRVIKKRHSKYVLLSCLLTTSVDEEVSA